MTIKNKSYWSVCLTDGSGYKVDEHAINIIRLAVVNGGPAVVDFTDIHGAECEVVIRYVTDWHLSTPEVRREAVQFRKQIDKDAGVDEEKPEWEQ